MGLHFIEMGLRLHLITVLISLWDWVFKQFGSELISKIEYYQSQE